MSVVTSIESAKDRFEAGVATFCHQVWQTLVGLSALGLIVAGILVLAYLLPILLQPTRRYQIIEVADMPLYLLDTSNGDLYTRIKPSTNWHKVTQFPPR